MAGTVGVTFAGMDNLSVTFGDPNASQVNDPGQVLWTHYQ